MTLLILGLAIWTIVHLLPVVAHPARERLAAAVGGETPWRGLFAVVILGSIVLMVIGYQSALVGALYYPPAWGLHLNNLLMLIAVGLLGASHSKGNVKRYLRHPMLWSVVVWAAAHLLVNGDTASVVLFGWLGVWAVVSMVGLNLRDGAWVKPSPAPVKKDLILVAITLAAYGAITAIHSWLGVSPFPM